MTQELVTELEQADVERQAAIAVYDALYEAPARERVGRGAELQQLADAKRAAIARYGALRRQVQETDPEAYAAHQAMSTRRMANALRVQ